MKLVIGSLSNYNFHNILSLSTSDCGNFKFSVLETNLTSIEHMVE